jgi:hypothetical protein
VGGGERGHGSEKADEEGCEEGEEEVADVSGWPRGRIPDSTEEQKGGDGRMAKKKAAKKKKK